jgi:hypothetical protein
MVGRFLLLETISFNHLISLLLFSILLNLHFPNSHHPHHTFFSTGCTFSRLWGMLKEEEECSTSKETEDGKCLELLIHPNLTESVKEGIWKQLRDKLLDAIQIHSTIPPSSLRKQLGLPPKIVKSSSSIPLSSASSSSSSVSSSSSSTKITDTTATPSRRTNGMRRKGKEPTTTNRADIEEEDENDEDDEEDYEAEGNEEEEEEEEEDGKRRKKTKATNKKRKTKTKAKTTTPKAKAKASSSSPKRRALSPSSSSLTSHPHSSSASASASASSSSSSSSSLVVGDPSDLSEITNNNKFLAGRGIMNRKRYILSKDIRTRLTLKFIEEQSKDYDLVLVASPNLRANAIGVPDVSLLLIFFLLLFSHHL